MLRNWGQMVKHHLRLSRRVATRQVYLLLTSFKFKLSMSLNQLVT